VSSSCRPERALMHADERTDQRRRRIVPAARLRSRRSIVIFGLHRSSNTHHCMIVDGFHGAATMPRRGQPLTAEGVEVVLSAARRRAGLDHATCHELRHTCLTRLQGRGVASDATFGTSREHALPAAQRAALRCPRPAGAPCGYGDLGLHGPPGSDATMMRLMPLRGVHHRCACWHRDASGCSRLHRAHHRRSR
jgi:hypothetical protein